MNHRKLPTPRPAAAWLLGLALLVTGLPALAQQDPPGRVARLNFHQGTISFSPAGDDSWYDAEPNRPLTTGDRLWTDRDARAELYVGSSAVRLDDQTELALSELGDDTARLTALQGSLALRVRDEDLTGRRFEIDTGNLAVVIDAPGEYRIDADPGSDLSHVAVVAGNATLYGEGGESLQLGASQQLTVSGRRLATAGGAPVQAGGGGFERWVAERNRLEDQSVSARYVSREVVGYQQLDGYGDWQNDPEYGGVWYPRNVDADWAPYQDGQWVDVAPWGWTWVDAAPWGFAPFHYGRWARIGPRWGWVPGRANTRPVYAPALVGFVGGAGANLAIGNGRNGVGWFPLAPGETWRPGYRASQRYVDEANRSLAFSRQAAARNAGFAHQRTPGALTVVPVDVFGRAPVTRRDLVRLPDAQRLPNIAAATAVPMPMPQRGERGFGGLGRPTGALPPGRPLPQAALPPAGGLRLPPQASMPQPPQPSLPRQVPQMPPRETWRQPPMQAPQGSVPAFGPARQEEAPRQQQQQQLQWQQQQGLRQQQMQQARQMQQAQQIQQREAMRQQEMQQRAAQAQALQQQQLQAQQLQLQQQQALRAQQQQLQMQQAQQIQQQMQRQNTLRLPPGMAPPAPPQPAQPAPERARDPRFRNGGPLREPGGS